ncbi:hypothetical protein HWV62_8148 [Athelia sp. TMB]|nr:hypothetical protein HWV62_8148 [Athelia sp. TMB]
MEVDPKCWQRLPRDPGQPQTWTCKICADSRPHQRGKLSRHEKSGMHLTMVELEAKRATESQQSAPLSHTDSVPSSGLPAYLSLVDSGTRALLHSLARTQPLSDAETNSTGSHLGPSHTNLAPISGWGLFEAYGDTELAPSEEQQSIAAIAQAVLEHFDNLSVGSEDENVERSDDDEEEFREPIVTVGIVNKGNGSPNSTDPPLKRTRTSRTDGTADPSAKWFPWHDKITCTLDILMHLPRSVFSQRQLDLFLWLLKVNDVDDVPSVNSMQTLNATLQKMCGVDSIKYKGALGHTYYVNSLSQIIAQEMANPKVRPHLEFYPEDSDAHLTEARQGRRWLHEIDNEQLTPMARLAADGRQDYYIHEPAMLRNGTCCVPVRWFKKKNQLYAKCWKMDVVASDTERGWRVEKSQDFTVPHTQFLKTFPQLCDDALQYGLPHPSRILYTYEPGSGTRSRWTFTNPIVGNRWRSRAKGHRTVAFPIWLYCDDTSGNLSKKWNEHNSFLFTPAGLPRVESQKEYNIHFLSTSNIAPPLEMMDGVVEQLQKCQDEGIWAWDCVANEAVLVIPAVLALLGDNPMQSEFACHIGLQGKFFCRACWTKGSDALAEKVAPESSTEDTSRAESPPFGTGGEGSAVGSDASSVPSDSDDEATQSSNPENQGKKGKGRNKKARETMSNMVIRVKAFLVRGRPRHKEETTTKLASMFEQASTLDTKTKVQSMRTETGIKDTFQMHFLDKLFKSYKGKRGRESKQAALDREVDALPPFITSPVWRIKGLDPHQDTPVEILHVILLGFVKYLWRDLVQNQLGKKQDKRDLLATRLSSFDVSGLGISPLAGQTLVQYSGSLTGRDFRAIAQVAPFVAYDMVSQDCMETWVSLSKLVPLIWQPEIADVEAHCSLLEREIDHFLLCAARWTIRWFNKPKFHILLHLPDHIRRFGPAILFATEAFESFNAIIRAKSVHSNRHAPSRDIALAFAQSNRVRHLLSGGRFDIHSFLLPNSNTTHLSPSLPAVDAASSVSRATAFSFSPNSWKVAGEGPRSLVHTANTVTHYLGLDDKQGIRQGACISDRKPARLINETLAGKIIPSSFHEHTNSRFKTCLEFSLQNGDKCRVGQWVVAKDPLALGATLVARVEEILQVQGSVAELSGMPDFILLQAADVRHQAPAYHMPRLKLTNMWACATFQTILCTVNAPHNCSDRQCGTSQTRPVYQERELTAYTRPSVLHVSPEDQILNLAQMRDAVHVQRFRQPSQMLDREHIILASAAKEIRRYDAQAKQIETQGPPYPFCTLDAAVNTMRTYGLLLPALATAGTPLLALLLAHMPQHALPLYALAAHHGLNLDNAAATRIGPVYLKRLVFMHLGRAEALRRLLLPQLIPHTTTEVCGAAQQLPLVRAWALGASAIVWDAQDGTCTPSLPAHQC